MLSADAIIDLVLDGCDEPTDGTGRWTRAKTLTRLNLNQDKITRKLPALVKAEDTTLTSVGAQAAYTIPTTVGKIITVRLDGRPLDETSEETLDRDSERGIIADDYKNDEGGQPSQWYRRQNQLFIFPTPAGSYEGLTITLLHELILTQLTDSASSYALENQSDLREMQDVLIDFTKAELLEDAGDYAKSDRKNAKAEKAVSEMAVKREILGKVRPESLCKDHGNEDDESDSLPGNYRVQ